MFVLAAQQQMNGLFDKRGEGQSSSRILNNHSSSAEVGQQQQQQQQEQRNFTLSAFHVRIKILKSRFPRMEAARLLTSKSV
jgi:hypothetical protein